MNRKRAALVLIWAIPAMMVAWAFYQLFDLYASKSAHQDASRMLFEASNFQVELLSRFLSESRSMQTSEQLNALKNAAYSASFVHDRFARAFPAGQVDDLESLDKILQYVLQLQIGGDRPLKDHERDVLDQLEPLFTQLAEAYAGLMTEGGKLNRYERGLIAELDNQLLDVLNRNN